MTVFYLSRFLHIAGVILLVGNITITAVWKVFAHRTRDPSIVAFGQRMATGTDIGLTLPGIALTMIGGYGALLEARYGFPGPAWLIWGQVCFVVAGLIWLGMLVPIKFRQARMASSFKDLAAVPEDYRKLARDWLIWGLIAKVPIGRCALSHDYQAHRGLEHAAGWRPDQRAKLAG